MSRNLDIDQAGLEMIGYVSGKHRVEWVKAQNGLHSHPIDRSGATLLVEHFPFRRNRKSARDLDIASSFTRHMLPDGRDLLEKCRTMQEGSLGSAQPCDMPGPLAEREPLAESQCPIDMLAVEHALQLELNKALECIADGLPDQVDRGLVGRVTAILDKGLAAHFEFEEKVLFPMLRASASASGEAALLAALDQLALEHDRDHDIDVELVEELRFLAEQGRARNAEMLGYVPRCCFEVRRRHIEWENAVILPAARRILGREQIEALRQVSADRAMRTALPSLLLQGPRWPDAYP